MPHLYRRASAGLLGLALPGLLALAGLSATASVEGVRAQEAAPAAEEAPSRGRRRGRNRHSRNEKPEAVAKGPALPPGMQQATPVVTFGDWNVFTNGQQGKGRVCYAIAQPQTRTPKTLARDTGYLFVTVRKGENVQNEIAVMFGFKPKPAAAQSKPGATAAKTDPYIALGSTRFGLVVKDENAWVQNQAEETRIVAEMGKAQTASVRTVSARGKPTNDEYAMGGFAEAVKRAREECK
ncbi:invasion associated locus b family protein [Methylobacterium sp. C25]|uniref:invasion associated locus b family protein n=1 Tax=Methylobacterium sp. C25 TaxID=2721622 RepID=UPI001F2997AE|nr:invasion associated locus b family protein [Methylobacterium sp. C25]MCE4223030.1 invasion associated locus b family protein [Methylobacterium sp. C25]